MGNLAVLRAGASYGASVTLPADASGAADGDQVVKYTPKIGSRVRSALVSTVLVLAVAVLGAVEPRDWVPWVLLVSQLPMAVIRWLVVRGTASAVGAPS